MPLPRFAPTTDVAFTVIVRRDPTIKPLSFDFDSALSDLPEPEPQEDGASYFKALQGWEQRKADAIIAAFLATPEAEALKVTRERLTEIRSEETARTAVLGLLEENRWRAYCETGDESVFDFDGEPVRFDVNFPTERDKVRAIGRLEQGPTHGVTDFEHTYEVSVGLLCNTLRNVHDWPNDWPKMARKGDHLTEQSIRLLPHTYVNQLATYLLNAAQLRNTEKKA